MSIGHFVTKLIAAGTSPELAAEVVAEVFAAGIMSGGSRQTVDAAAERRREWDRERKRADRAVRLPESDWLEVVSTVLKRDAKKCTYCDATENLTADHVVPLSRGGTNDLSNLTACCIRCNSKKSNRLVCEWLPDATDVSTLFHPTVRWNPPDDEMLSLSKVRSKDERERPKARVHPTTRLPEDWSPTPEDANAATAALGRDRAAAELQKFRDYCRQQSGSKALCADWNARWRIWVSRAEDHTAKSKPPAATPAADQPIDWEPIVRTWTKTGYWSHQAGPDPESPACRCPRDLIEKLSAEVRQ